MKLDANKKASNFIKEKILNTVKDKKVAEILTNFDHPFTSKRPTLNTNYYETFNKDNVFLIDLKEHPIQKITANTLESDKTYEVDTLIMATGFDAITGALTNIDISGNEAKIYGKNKLNGAELMATDLRASVSLVLAGLAANGKTIINRIYHLDRGYEKIENKLSKCGAFIKRIANDQR